MYVSLLTRLTVKCVEPMYFFFFPKCYKIYYVDNYDSAIVYDCMLTFFFPTKFQRKMLHSHKFHKRYIQQKRGYSRRKSWED